MKYTVNDSIVFDSGEGVLRHPETNDVVPLPLPAQRLLQIILDSECEILSRDFLFCEVWDKYGLTGSNSNLNQYLSLLRRSMLVFGCKNFVITFPKVGIKLDEHVVIVKTPSEERPNDAGESEAAEPLKDEKSGKSFLWLAMTGIAALILITLAGIWILDGRNTARDPVFTSHTLQTGCVIHTVKSESEYYSKKIESLATKILKANNLSCRKGFNVYLDYYTSSAPQTYGRTMLSLCRVGADGINRSCDNVYYSDWNEIND